MGAAMDLMKKVKQQQQLAEKEVDELKENSADGALEEGESAGECSKGAVVPPLSRDMSKQTLGATGANKTTGFSSQKTMCPTLILGR